MNRQEEMMKGNPDDDTRDDHDARMEEAEQRVQAEEHADAVADKRTMGESAGAAMLRDVKALDAEQRRATEITYEKVDSAQLRPLGDGIAFVDFGTFEDVSTRHPEYVERMMPSPAEEAFMNANGMKRGDPVFIVEGTPTGRESHFEASWKHIQHVDLPRFTPEEMQNAEYAFQRMTKDFPKLSAEEAERMLNLGAYGTSHPEHLRKAQVRRPPPVAAPGVVPFNRAQRRRKAARDKCKAVGRLIPAEASVGDAQAFLAALVRDVSTLALKKAFAGLATDQVDFAIAALLKAGCAIARETGRDEHAARCFAANMAGIVAVQQEPATDGAV